MPEFIPTNSLEIQLRALLNDKHTPVWKFYTPLAAAELFIISRNYPELDGSEQVAPEGKNPEVCVFTGENRSIIGVYTSAGRAQQAFDLWKLSLARFTSISAKGWPLLKYLEEFEAELWINAGLKECQYCLDPDLVEILLSRPEPPDEEQPESGIIVDANEEAPAFLTPLHDFLARQKNVRAAWVFRKPDVHGNPAYDVGIVATDPQDDAVLEAVGTVVKAITPVQVECEVIMMMADDLSLQNLSKQQPPFYTAADFLKKSGAEN